MLEVRGLTVRYGGVAAVQDLSFEVEAGEILGLIGPNGAGKSTTVNAISGATRPAAGEVRLAGRDTVGRRPDQVARLGLGRTFQQAELWRGMDVRRNLAVPVRSRGRREVAERARAVAGLVGIESMLDRECSGLPYGTRRLVEVARALMSDPVALVLDEPAAGLSRGEKKRLQEVVEDVAAQGVAVVLIDHDMGFVMTTCHRLVVMDAGRLIAEGPPEQVRRDPSVRTAYLGGAEE